MQGRHARAHKVTMITCTLSLGARWGAELNARITPAFFTWLVGPMTTVEVDIDGVKQSSGVHIKRCRCAAVQRAGQQASVSSGQSRGDSGQPCTLLPCTGHFPLQRSMDVHCLHRCLFQMCLVGKLRHAIFEFCVRHPRCDMHSQVPRRERLRRHVRQPLQASHSGVSSFVNFSVVTVCIVASVRL